MTAPQAKVRRDGRVTLIPASGAVAGDILALEAGDLVAADARLLSAASLTCIESRLTGESEAVTKQIATLAVVNTVLLLAVGAIPPLILEIVEIARHALRPETAE